MAIINPWPEEYQDNYCARRRHLLIADLCSLHDRELQEFGLWRGAIRDVAEKLLTHENCHPHKNHQ